MSTTRKFLTNTTLSHSPDQDREHGLRLPAQDAVPATGNRALVAAQGALVGASGIQH